MARSRQLVGLLTLLALIAIVFGVTGFELPLPRIGGAPANVALPGVRAVAATTLVKVGQGAPPGGEMAFMAVEPSGNLVVSDAKRRSVLRFDSSGHLLTEWGPRLGDLELGEPAGVASVGASYYVMDRGTPRIVRLDANGQVQAIFDLASLSTYGLNGLAVDANGNLYAADTGRNRILVFSPNGQLVKQVGHGGNDLGGFTQPMMLAFEPDGSFVVADWENNRLERFDANFQATDAWTVGFHAFGVATDQIGRVYAPDFDHRRIEVYTPQGGSLGEMGVANSPTIDVAPKQVAIAPSGPPALYVLGSDAIQRIDLENTPPPPQGGPESSDLFSVLVIVLMVLLVVAAVVSRRQRQRAAASVHAALDRPVRLHAENGAQRQKQQTETDQELLVANKPKREQ